MGQDVGHTGFGDEERLRFAQRLADETRRARSAFATGESSRTGGLAGFELEAWLVDRCVYPVPCSQSFLARTAEPLVVAELSRFNVELNGTPQPLHGRGLSMLESELAATWARCRSTAHADEAAVIAIGTLPTLREADLSLASMTPARRHQALNQQVLEARGGRPITLRIDGRERLLTTHADVMLEAATTLFHVHLQVPADQIARHPHASMLLSAPLVALSANSPFLFGRTLWHETRFPVFERAAD